MYLRFPVLSPERRRPPQGFRIERSPKVVFNGNNRSKHNTKREEGGFLMAQKELLDKMSIYVPQSKIDKQPVERLIKLGERRDRSVNYLVVEAILQYLDREETKS